MPLDVYNGLLGIKLWFGAKEEDGICLFYHLDLFAAMNTGDLRDHQWLMTKYILPLARYII